MPDAIDTARVLQGLVPPVAGPVVWAAEAGSTNDLVAMRARAGAAEGLVIGADFQTAGPRTPRTHLDRRPRRGGCCSRSYCGPRASGRDVGLLPIAAAVGVAEGLRHARHPVRARLAE